MPKWSHLLLFFVIVGAAILVRADDDHDGGDRKKKPMNAGVDSPKDCKDDCLKILKQSPYGFPNLGHFAVFPTDNSEKKGLDDNDQLLVSLITTIGLPAVWMGYYGHKINGLIHPDWEALVNRDWNTDHVLRFSPSSFGSGMALLRLLEFEDQNSNGVFDPDADTVVTSYDFLNTSATTYRIKWNPMTLTSTPITADSGDSAMLYVFNVTSMPTNDGSNVAMSLQFSMSSAAYTMPDTGALVSPNITKIDFQVSNYPYQGSAQSRLALDVILAGTAANINAPINSDDNVTVNAGDLFQFSWVKKAKIHDDKETQVKAGAFVPFDLADDGGNSNSAQQLRDGDDKYKRRFLKPFGTSLFAAAVRNQTGANLLRVYYSFDTARPSFVYWDPSIGFNLASTSSIALWIALGVTAGILMLGAGLMYFYRGKIAAQPCVQNSACLSRCFQPSNPQYQEI